MLRCLAAALIVLPIAFLLSSCPPVTPGDRNNPGIGGDDGEPGVPGLGVNASMNGAQVFPADNPWNTPVDTLPVDPNSDDLIDSIGRSTTFHPDFGANWNGGPFGIPYIVVSGDTPGVNVTIQYASESDKGPTLCVLSTPAGEGHFTKTFSSDGTIKQCRVRIRFAGRGQSIRLSLGGPGGASFQGTVPDGMVFYWGRDFPPNAPVTVSVDQDVHHPGVTVIIDDQPFGNAAGLTDWQILSRGWAILLAVSGLVAWASRNSVYAKRRLISAYIFQMLALGVTLMFFYLLFHEGGHAVASYCFGGNGFSGSDFWGIHGSPHAGGMNEHFKSWQRALTSFAGPASPTLAGWILFLWWRSRQGRHFRSRFPLGDLFLSSINAMLVFAYAMVTVPMMLGFLIDGDWEGFIDNVPGPLWLVHTLLTVSVLLSLFILWKTVPHAYRLFRIETSRIKEATASMLPLQTAAANLGLDESDKTK